MRYARQYVLLLLCLVSYSGSFCQPSGPTKALKYVKGKTRLTKYLDEKKWKQLFPNRYNVATLAKADRKDFYSFKAFVAAAKKFPLFLGQGDEDTRKRELCAFLANIAQETSGGWGAAPGGYYKWGLFYQQELDCQYGCSKYSDTGNKEFPPVKNVSYHGRGPKQLSWNYNYGQFSAAWYGDKEALLKDPDMLIKDSVISFASAIWFWMTPQKPKPSCHDIMCGKWTPTSIDVQNGRLPGFGATINVINGGIECGKPEGKKTRYRYEYYKYFCSYFKVSPGENIDCSEQKPFNVQ
jgi:hypothetical protein